MFNMDKLKIHIKKSKEYGFDESSGFIDPNIYLSKKKQKKKRKEIASTKESKEGTFEDFQNPYNVFSGDLNVYTNVNLDRITVPTLFDVNLKTSKFFVVDEDVFLDLEPAMISDDQYFEYSLYKVMKTESAVMHDLDDELTDEDLKEELFITLEIVDNNQGAIINFNVYLTYQQWNTITLLDKHSYFCFLCQFQCDASSVAGHIESISHLRKLSEHLPLKRFDLSITRKINENFHCAVCNVMYPIKNYRDHENSKAHEGNLLSAINKVSDILRNSETKTIQLLNTNNIRQPNNAPRHMVNTELYRNTDSFGNIHSRNTEYFTEDGIHIYEEDDNEQYTLSKEGVSYASVASKPRLELPKFLKIDLGTKEVRVKFESWNMITQIDLNTFYCMACIELFLIRYKNQHCMGELHRRSLANCAVVGAFEDYLIRDVDEKLYHCGHCNNLQYKNDIKFHVEKYHPIKNPTTVFEKNQSSPSETYKITDRNEDRYIYSNAVNNAPRSYESAVEVKSLKGNLDMFGDFKFFLFGTEMLVSNLACHMLMLVNSQYHCALCNVYIEGDLMDHVYEMAHIQLINMTSFIRPFQSHLTRAVRGSLHCALCNILIPVAGIYDHNVSPPHTSAFARARGMAKSERPQLELKYQFKGPADFKTTLEKFLSTLPANYREALSNLQIENQKAETIDLSDTASQSSCSTNNTPQPTLNNSPLHIKKGYTTEEPHTMIPTDKNGQKDATEINPLARAFFAKFKSPLNNASNLQEIPLNNANNLKGLALNTASNAKDLPLNTASNPKGLPVNTASNAKDLPLNTASNPKGLPVNTASNAKDLPVNTASNPKGLPLNNESNPKDPPLKNASNPKGLSLNNESNPKDLPLKNASKPKGLPLKNASKPKGLLNNASNKKGLPLKNASNPKGLAPNDASNFKDPPIYYDANMKSLCLETGQLVSLDTVESGSPRVGSGARVNPSPVQMPITGPMETGFGRRSVAPFKRSKDVGIVNGLLSPHNGRVEIEKCEEKSSETTSEIINELIASDEEEISAPFKLDETILLKLNSSYFKVTNTAYQSLVHLGNGSRFCFVCSNSLDSCLLQKHVDSQEHIDNISKNNFLLNYCGQLLRQVFLMYHCAICNVTMSQKEIRMHLEWPTHVEKYEQACIDKKNLKVASKSCAKEYRVKTQKECQYAKTAENAKITIVTYVQSSKEDFEDTFVEKELVRRSQMIILRGNIMKVCFESWHGVMVGKSGTKCIICQLELSEDSLPSHLETEDHNAALGITFEKQFYPALIRKINSNTVNCVICNLELLNDDSLVFEHINGRKHVKNSSIIEKKSYTESYGDHNPYPITLRE